LGYLRKTAENISGEYLYIVKPQFIVSVGGPDNERYVKTIDAEPSFE
jgi:hypothetical protein